LFFILSGFILMHVHSNEFASLRSDRVKEFYVLRFFRVYPLNTAVLIILVPITLLLPALVSWFRLDHGVPIPYHARDFSAGGFLQSLFLAQTWTVLKLGEWNGPAWSLSAEVFGYALFPALAYILVRSKSAVACASCAFASLVCLMALLTLFGHAQDNPTGSFGLVRMIFSFVAGMSMARCFHLVGPHLMIGAPVTYVSAAFIAAALWAHWSNMFVVFGFCGLIFGLAFQHGVLNSLLTTRPAMFFGRISFSFYMVHYVPLKMAIWLLQTGQIGEALSTRLFVLVAVVLACLVLALGAYHGLELRFQRYAREILRRARTDHAQSVSA